MASFYVIRGKDNGQHFSVRGPTAKIGRGSNVQIRLDDTEVSRQHAMIIRYPDGEHEIVDNSSSNGTFVNSRRVSRQRLRSGDRVQVGRTLLIYTGGPEPHGSNPPSSGSKGTARSNTDMQGSGASAPSGSNSLARTKPDEPDAAPDSVEIITGVDLSDLSHIRQSLESHQSVSASDLFRRPPTESQASLGSIQLDSPTRHDAPATVADDDTPPPSNWGEGTDGPTDDWEIIFQVGQAVRRTLELDELLAQVLELIFEWIQCDRGCILLQDEVGGSLAPHCSRDRKSSETSEAGPPSSTGSASAASAERSSRFPKPARRRSPIRISRTILEHVIDRREGVLTSNAQDDKRWENVESIASIGVHEAICVPMLGRYGVVGAIYVDTTVSAGVFAERHGQLSFTGQHLKLMLAIAGQAALAVEDTQYYQAALQSERLAAMGQTIANLSHHVKNILQGIRGGSFLVEDGLRNEKLDVVQKGWGIVERNQQRISNLVMDMLSFSKDRDPDFASADVRELLTEIAELMRPIGEEKGVRVQCLLPAQASEVEFDSEAIHRAVLNVVTNAIDAAALQLANDLEELSVAPESIASGTSVAEAAARATASVTLGVDYQPRKNLVSIRVADTGPGIDEADVNRIFAPFESDKGSRGTGLGLPVSRKILREHGGDISVTRDPVRGTVFTLAWPIRQNPPTAPADPAVEKTIEKR